MFFHKFDEYYQKLLKSQFEISDIIEHALTRGQMREDFLKSIIISQFPNLQIVSGIVTNDREQSPQTDLIFTSHNCRTRQLGQYNLVNIDDCKMLLEVKSNATGTDFKKFNTDAGKVKSLGNDSVICGIFCYKLDLKIKTVIERFGYKYNKEYQIYEENGSGLLYPNIDFVVCIDSFDENDEDKEVCIIYNSEKYNGKNDDDTEKPRGGYSLSYDKPAIKLFFNILNGLYRN